VWRRRGWRADAIGALVVAARGVWTPAERRAARGTLRGLARRVEVISDAEAAWLGALDGRAGVLVLAGTGSIVLGCDARGRWARAGGLGPLFGDEGSAFWLGRQWLRARPDVARRLARAPDAVARIAARAPAVLARARDGDRRAAAIVREGQDRLAALAHEVARALALRGVVDVGWAGGLMADPWFRAGVRRALARRAVRARWHPPAAPPVLAAARLAARSL
jgi:N-acetylglucosamine kinase-like BadF-type ATPase